jgi:hypothetical protein
LGKTTSIIGSLSSIVEVMHSFRKIIKIPVAAQMKIKILVNKAYQSQSVFSHLFRNFQGYFLKMDIL